MKKIVILMLIAMVLSACSSGDEPMDNGMEDQKESVSENVYEDEDKGDEEKTETLEESELSDQEKIYAFLAGYIDTLEYPVALNDLTILYGDITLNGQEDILVTLSTYNGVVLTREEDSFSIIGILELGKTLDNVAIEDGFIIYDIGLSGTGTATNYKSIYKYNGNQVILLEQLVMVGYDAGGDITMEGDLYLIDGYESFAYDYKKINVANDLVLEASSATYVFNNDTNQYDVERQVLISEDMNGIYLSELSPGQEIEGFIVDSLEASDDVFNLVMTGDKLVKGKIGSYYNEMYDENQLYFVSDEPIIEQVFFHQFKDDLEPEPYGFAISFDDGWHEIYNFEEKMIEGMENLLNEGQEIEVELEVTGLYAGGRFRSEGGQSISIQNIKVIDPFFDTEETSNP